MFLLTEYCHVTYADFWDMPIPLRKWLLERKQKENEKIKEAQARARGKQTVKASPAPKKRPSR